MRFLFLGVLSAATFASSAAFADDFDRDSVREEVYCFPTKFAIETVTKLEGADADKKDVVAPPLSPRFRIFDGGELPQRYFIRPETENENETDFTILADGSTPDFMPLVKSADKGSDICIKDESRIGRPGDDESLYFEMGLTPEFKNRSGMHTLAELIEGTKDGKSLYKKMIPSVARLFMPSTDHLSLTYDAKEMPFQAAAYKDGQPLQTIDFEKYGESFIFDLEDIKDMGADSLKISGGAYTLSPVPSVKTMKKYGIGEKKIYTQNADGEWVR